MPLSLSQQERLFDQMYQREGFSYAAEPPSLLKQAVERTSNSGQALDLGCGDGRVSLYLAEKGFEVTAVDISHAGLAKLRRFAVEKKIDQKITTIKADVRSFDPDDGPFDLISLVTILDHLPAGDIAPTFARVVRWLQPGGLIHVKVHTVDDPGHGGDAPSSESAAAIDHYFERGELRRLADGALVIDAYEERREEDTTHGERHFHAFAELLGRKQSAQLPLI